MQKVLRCVERSHRARPLTSRISSTDHLNRCLIADAHCRPRFKNHSKPERWSENDPDAMNLQHPQRILPNGFTLIEMMIAVAIIAILSAIAYPNYQSYIKKSRRADAYRSLGGIGLAQEKYRSNNSQYTSTLTDIGFTSSSSDGYYTLAITSGSASASGYIATATATGSQIGDVEGSTSCGTLTLTASGSTQTYTPTECWKK